MYIPMINSTVGDLMNVVHHSLPDQDAAIHHGLTSTNKAFLIDAPIVWAAGAPATAVSMLPVYAMKFFIRSAGKEAVAKALNELAVDKDSIPTISSISAGVVAGIIKGGLAGSNIPAESIGNVFYELCNDNEKCSSPVGLALTGVVLETADPFAKTFFSGMGRELLRMSFATAPRAGMDEVHAMIKQDGYMKPFLLAVQGVAIVQVAFIPNIKLIPDLYNCFKADDAMSCLLDTTLNIAPSMVNNFNHLTFNCIPKAYECTQVDDKLNCGYEVAKETAVSIGSYLKYELADIADHLAYKLAGMEGYIAQVVGFSAGDEF